MKTTDGNTLSAYDHRPGTAPTLVFLHYWGGSSRTWAPVTDRLGDRDVVTIDFRGWGRSRTLPGPYTLQQLAEDTLAVIADAEIANYVLVGHSMGGKVAQMTAAMHPAGLRGLVLVGSAPALPAAEITGEYQQGLSHAYDTVETTAAALDNILTASPLPDKIKAQVIADSRASATGARQEWPLHGIAEDITDRTRMITVPTLVVAGENDQVEPVEVLRQNLVRYLVSADVLVIPRVGHLIPLEAPAALADAIGAFSPVA